MTSAVAAAAGEHEIRGDVLAASRARGEVVEVQAMGANLIEPYIAEVGDIDSAMVVLRGAGGELCQIVNSRRCSFGYDQRLGVNSGDHKTSFCLTALFAHFF